MKVFVVVLRIRGHVANEIVGVFSSYKSASQYAVKVQLEDESYVCVISEFIVNALH